jgi:hypothetical protein
MKTHQENIQEYVDSMKKDILSDRKLALCTSFSELHNYCDANVLGDIEERHFDNTEEMISFANEGMDIIDTWLRERQYENN